MAGLMDDDILNDELFRKIAPEINGVTPEQLSDYLWSEVSQGSNARNLSSDQLEPYVTLLRQFVRRYGKDIKSALKLHFIFLERDMEPCAKIIGKGIWRPIISTYKSIFRLSKK